MNEWVEQNEWTDGGTQNCVDEHQLASTAMLVPTSEPGGSEDPKCGSRVAARGLEVTWLRETAIGKCLVPGISMSTSPSHLFSLLLTAAYKSGFCMFFVLFYFSFRSREHPVWTLVFGSIFLKAESLGI